jgi:hypothetical protein
MRDLGRILQLSFVLSEIIDKVDKDSITAGQQLPLRAKSWGSPNHIFIHLSLIRTAIKNKFPSSV